jgi:adenosylmethionine-8-amino-7-oxononanoate aminotransferase
LNAPHATDVAPQRDDARLFVRDKSHTTMVRGSGIRFWDTEGREYIDASSGAISVISIGHGVAEVADAMAEQARRLAYVHTWQFRHEPGEALARAVADFAPDGLGRVLLVSGGSEATETAVKLARQYHLLRGNPSKHVIVSRSRSFHGASLAALSFSGVPMRRLPFAPYLLGEPQMMPCYCYRCPVGLTYPSCALHCATDLERVIAEVGADQISAFIAEPIVAAAGPGMTPPPGYFERIRAVCDEHDILFIADEVVTGFGRTGKNFGIQHWDVLPDMITSAKGLAGGYAPLGVVIVRDEIVEPFESGGDGFAHGFTFDTHPVCCAAGLAVLSIIERDGLVANAALQGEHLFERLRELAGRHAVLGDVRGMGLLAGLELVADRDTKRPFDPKLGVGPQLYWAARERGLILYQGAGADGVAGDQLIVSPPLTVTRAEVDEIVDRLDLALGDLRDALAL